MKTRNYSLQQRINRTEAIYHALGEAAYEGNIGAVEVAQFYMNADDNQIQEFETELDNGNETEAWDIVQRFHGVDLVGIGSDQPSPRAERVAGQIDEYFNKKNNKKTLTYELLYEMVKDVYLSESNLGGKQLIRYGDRIKKFIEKIKSNSPFELVKGGTAILPADEPMNKELIQKLEKYLETGDDSVLKNERGQISLNVTDADGRVFATSKLKKTKDEFGGGSTGTSATAFEGNLVVAINAALKAPDAEKIEAAMLCGSKDKKTGECKNNWMEDTPEAREQAALIATRLIPKINDVLPAPIKVIDKNSGSGGGGLSQAYLAMGVKSAEPKADLSINADPRFGVSVKKSGGSQYASAQAPEAKAMFEVAYREVNPEGDLEQQIAELQEYITNTAGRPGLGKFYQLKDKVVTMLTADGQDASKVDTAYQKVQARLSGMSMEKGSAKRLEVPEEQKEAFAATLRAMTEEGIQPLKESVREILVSDRFRIAVFKEAATGRGKFQNPGDAANWVLKWNPASPQNSSFEELSDEWFKAQYKSGAVKFRMRNRGDAEKRGGAFNIDAIKPSEKTMTADDNLQEWWQDDKYYTEDAFSHDEFILSEALEQQLVEGVLDSMRDMLAKVYGSTKAAIDWGLEQVKAFAAAARDYINRFVGFLKEAMSRGFGAFADFLGFEIYGLEYEI